MFHNLDTENIMAQGMQFYTLSYYGYFVSLTVEQLKFTVAMLLQRSIEYPFRS